MPHRIRLGPPWTSVPCADGRSQHRRHFGSPRTLDPGERVWIVIPAEPAARVFLNGDLIGATTQDEPGFSSDITSRLRPRNELLIDSASIQAPAEVALLISSEETGPSSDFKTLC